MTDLGTLGGVRSYATGINNSGQVVGYSFITNFISKQAFITDPDGADMTSLGTLGGRKSEAIDINDSGEVIGWAETADDFDHAFLFSHGGMTDLSLLDVVVSGGWSGLTVTDINNNGQIVGSGYHNGRVEAFILSYTPDTLFTPQSIFIPPPGIPEPETYAMLLAGLGLVGFMARRRKKASV
jgi:probable HAF family extracellular repeat protein